MRLGQPEAMAGGDRGPNAERHRERSNASDIFTAARHSDDHWCDLGKVWTLLIDAETGVGGLLAGCAADLPVARFRPAATSARMRGQRSISYCSGRSGSIPELEAGRDAMGARARRLSSRRLEGSFDGWAKSGRGPLAIIYADETTYASKFATGFDESFPLDHRRLLRSAAPPAEIGRFPHRGSAPAPTISGCPYSWRSGCRERPRTHPRTVRA